MRKHVAKNEINSKVLIFDKFITNAHKKEKNCVLAIIIYSSKHIWVLNVVWALRNEFECWYNIRNKKIETFLLFSNDDEITSNDLTFEVLFAIAKIFVKFFRIQMIVDNDDKYKRNIWSRWKMRYFEMRNVKYYVKLKKWVVLLLVTRELLNK